MHVQNDQTELKKNPSKGTCFLSGAVAGVISFLIALIVLITIMAVAENDGQGILALGERLAADFKIAFYYGGIYALVLGFPGGGIGGLISGIKWKTKKASIIGGSIAGILLIPVAIILFLVLLFGL